MTNAEVILWSRLRRHPTVRFRRQHPVGRFIADFACVQAKLVIEVDGATHGSDARICHDRRRKEYLGRQGWRVLRITNDDVYRRLDDILDAIMRMVLQEC
jgi:very-short-patch-repair endonuclease